MISVAFALRIVSLHNRVTYSVLTVKFKYLFIYVSALFKTLCLILISSYASLYVFFYIGRFYCRKSSKSRT